jgi:hypothetical protein
MSKKTKWTQKILLGTVGGGNIWLSAPSWDCGRYWGFGYLGNKNCHYHLDSLDLDKEYNKHLFDRIKAHFDIGSLFLANDSELWKFCELVLSAYTLKETAEFFIRGGAYCTTNPLAEKLKNVEIANQINNELLPSIFDALFDLFNQQEAVKKQMIKDKHDEIKKELCESKTQTKKLLKAYREFAKANDVNLSTTN